MLAVALSDLRQNLNSRATQDPQPRIHSRQRPSQEAGLWAKAAQSPISQNRPGINVQPWNRTSKESPPGCWNSLKRHKKDQRHRSLQHLRRLSLDRFICNINDRILFLVRIVAMSHV